MSKIKLDADYLYIRVLDHRLNHIMAILMRYHGMSKSELIRMLLLREFRELFDIDEQFGKLKSNITVLDQETIERIISEK